MGRTRVCLFTGVSGRLGTAFCSASIDEYQILGTYRMRKPAFRFPADGPDGSSFVSIQADVRDEANRERVIDTALEKFGKIDVLVNSAVHSVWAPMLDSNRVIESATAQFQTNVLAPLQLAVLCARRFWCDRKAANLEENRNVINVSSIAGTNVYSGVGQSVYAASKAALDHLSRHMAVEFGEIGIRVNALAPNSFSRIIPTDRVVESLKELDRGTMTGRIFILDRDGATFK